MQAPVMSVKWRLVASLHVSIATEEVVSWSSVYVPRTFLTELIDWTGRGRHLECRIEGGMGIM